MIFQTSNFFKKKKKGQKTNKQKTQPTKKYLMTDSKISWRKASVFLETATIENKRQSLTLAFITDSQTVG